MNGKKIKKYLPGYLILMAVSVIAGSSVALLSYKKTVSYQNIPSAVSASEVKSGGVNNNNCWTEEENVISGSSLSGMMEPGQKIYILKRYYDCHSVNRGDIVAYNYAGNSDLLAKIVKAIPGDEWHLKSSGDGNQIIVNGKPLKNSYGQNYIIPFANSSMLDLYSKSYPVIPANTFLILGNQIQGTLDSTRFGLVGLTDIVGKIEKAD